MQNVERISLKLILSLERIIIGIEDPIERERREFHNYHNNNFVTNQLNDIYLE